MSALRINGLPFSEGLRSYDQGAVSHPEKKADYFSELLDKAIQSSGMAPVADSKTPLSKTEIMNILEGIRMNMNTQLMRALAPDTEGEAPIPGKGLGGPFIPPGLPSSKNHHLNQNNDVSRGNGAYEGIIKEAARTHGVDAALIESVIKVESNFDTNSTSAKGAMGLMQLMPETARELGVMNAYDPVENIRAGTRYLKSLLNRYDGSVHMALAAYNWGMGNLERRPGQMPSETRQYIAKVTGQ